MSIYSIACKLARKTADLFAHPWSIVLFPFFCGAWLLAGGSELGLTLVLSVLAISVTQLVLLSQDRDTKAIHIKLDALIAGVPDADDRVAGIEQGDMPPPAPAAAQAA